jgi:hypothetical protein
MTKPLMHSKTAETKKQEKKRMAKKEDKPALIQTQSLEEKLARPITSLKLKGLQPKIKNRAFNYLAKNIAIKTLGDLTSFREQDLRSMKYLRGEKTIRAIQKELSSMGLSLGMSFTPIITDVGVIYAAKLPDERKKADAAKEAELVDKLASSVDKFDDPSVRLQNILKHANIQYIYQLAQKTEYEAIRFCGFGKKSLKEAKNLLADMGLSLGMKLDAKLMEKVEAKIKTTLRPVGSRKSFEKVYAGIKPKSAEDILAEIRAKQSDNTAKVDAPAPAEKPKEEVKIHRTVSAEALAIKRQPELLKEEPIATICNGVVIHSNLPKEKLQELVDRAIMLEKINGDIEPAKNELKEIERVLQPGLVKSISRVLNTLFEAFRPKPHTSFSVDRTPWKS